MKITFFAIVCAVMASALMFGCSGPAKQADETKPADEPAAIEQEPEEDVADDAPHATANTVFGLPDQQPVSSGSGGNLGTVAVFSASSDECTRENLETWCNQYVRWGLDNWCVIEYTDRPGYGVYAMGDLIEADVQLDADHMLVDDSEETAYIFSGDNPAELGTLNEFGA